MPSDKKQTVLIVDDEPLNIKLLSQALSPWYRVKAALNGLDALGIARSEDPPDLILLDISMPEMDGYSVCTELKEADSTKAIPIIFLTGKRSLIDEAKGLELGAVDYITKPFSLPIVMARIRNQMLLKIKTDMLEQLVAIDSLTEIANRRRFDEILSQEWRRSLRNQNSISVMMIDIDYFKKLNDSHGHTAGDLCLKQVAKALKGCLHRSSDFIARYGGEEFVVILSESSHHDACQLAEILRKKIASLTIANHLQPSKIGPITISIGLATSVPQIADTQNQIIEEADGALYEAKQNGRNRIVAKLL